MPVSTLTRSQTFAGGQSVLTFNFATLYNIPTNIQVNVVALSGGTITPLVYGTGYSVTVNSSGVGGTVTVSPTYSTAYNYVVYRETPLTQLSTYTNFNAFPASTLQNNIDALTMIAQESSNNTSLCLALPLGSSPSISTVLPLPSGSTFLAWDPTGMFIQNTPGVAGPIGPSGSGITLVSSSTTDLSVTTTPSSATITSVNAPTAGTNAILRLTSAGSIAASVLNLSTILNSINVYATSSSTSFLVSASALKIAYGTVSFSGTAGTITNLPFAGTNTYTIIGINNENASAQVSLNVTQVSSSSAIFLSTSSGITVNWVAIGT